MSDKAQNLVNNFKAQLAADRRKAAILGVLLLVFLGVTAHAIFSGSDPAPAAASDLLVPPAASASTQAPASADTSLKRPTPADRPAPPVKRARGAIEPGSPAAKLHDPLTGGTVSVAGLSRTPIRDLFTVPDWSVFHNRNSDEAGHGALPVPSATEAADSASVDAEAERALAEKDAEARKALEALELQSTLIGTVRSAHISGRMVYEGESIAGFEVVRIKGGEVALRKDGRLYSLLMR